MIKTFLNIKNKLLMDKPTDIDDISFIEITFEGIYCLI